MIPNLKIDDQFRELLKEYKWYISSTGYVVATYSQGKRGQSTTLSLARMIMSVTDPKVLVDHINGDPLDNRRSNLRLVDRSLNRMNSKKINGIRVTSSGKWQARITWKGRTLTLGSFDSYDAAKAERDQVANRLMGL